MASTSIQQPPTWGQLINRGCRVQIAIAAVLLAFVYGSTIQSALVGRWINDGDWSHGWLIPAFSLYFLGSRRNELATVKARPSYLGVCVLGLSLALYFYASWWQPMIYPRALSIVGSIFGITLTLGGWPLVRVAWFPIAFLILAIPFPPRVYVALTRPLQEFATIAAAAIMPLFASGLHTEAQGVVIDYLMPGSPPNQLNVEEACSGMRMTMALVTLGIAMAYLRARPGWHRVAMVLCCVPTAIFCNVIRVTTTGLFIVHGHPDLARGTPHQMLGLLMLALALAIFTAIDYVLSHLFVEESVGVAEES